MRFDRSGIGAMMPRRRRRSLRAGRAAGGRTIAWAFMALAMSIVVGMLAGRYAVPDVTPFHMASANAIADAERRREARAAAVLDAEIRDGF